MAHPPLTTRELDQLAQQHWADAHPGQPPEVYGFGIDPPCHPDDWLEVVYYQGVLLIHCARCHEEVMVVAVASPPEAADA